MSGKTFTIDKTDPRLSAVSQFISSADQAQEPEKPAKAKPSENRKASSRKKASVASPEVAEVASQFDTASAEKRTKRMVLLVTPTLFERIEAVCKATGLSKNELVIQSLEKTLNN